VEAEVDADLAAHAAERDEGGRRLVVRNGHARQRQVLTAAGAIPVRAPRVEDPRTDPVTGQRVRFRSVILPPWCRKSPKVAEVLSLLYLYGLSTGDFAPALAAFFGSAAGLSAAVITRLVAAWQAEDQTFCQRDLADRDDVDLWADGSPSGSAWEQAHRCWLVLLGVRADGPRSWWRSPTASASRPTAGPSCCGICAAAACGRRWWPSATAGWGCGPPCGRCSGPPATSATGSTRPQACWRPCPPACTPGRGRRWPRSGMPPTATTPSAPSRRSPATTASSGPRRSPRSPTTPRRCCALTTSRPSIGGTARPATPSNRPSPRCGCAPEPPREPGSTAAGLAMTFKLLKAAQDRWRAVNDPAPGRPGQGRRPVRAGGAGRGPHIDTGTVAA
jgi:hypothetical protein